MQCISVPIANKIWWIVTSFGWYAQNTSDRGVTLFVSEQRSLDSCDLNLSWKQHIFITYWHAICNKILRIVSYVRWYTENNTSDPSVTFLASEQKISGDCGLSISHNYHYLIKLVIYFEFLSNTLLQIGTHLQCNCVPNCNKLLQIGTHLQCKCVPICNKLLQIGTHLHCNCVPICNKLLQIGTHLQCNCVPICNKILYFRWYADNTGDHRVTLFASKQQVSGECGLWLSHKSYHLIDLVQVVQRTSMSLNRLMLSRYTEL